MVEFVYNLFFIKIHKEVSMVWGTFTLQHILSLAAIILFAISLYLVLKRIPDKAKTYVLFAVSLVGVAAVLYDLFRWGQPLLYLPKNPILVTLWGLALCYLAARGVDMLVRAAGRLKKFSISPLQKRENGV